MTNWQIKKEAREISVMHLINNNIKLKYSYNANIKHFNISAKKRLIVTKMDFLYV